jgi:hypothetical protein
MLQVHKPVRVQAFVSQSAVEALGKSVLYRLSWPYEIELNTFTVGPLVQGTTGEFRPARLRGFSIYLTRPPVAEAWNLDFYRRLHH